MSSDAHGPGQAMNPSGRDTIPPERVRLTEELGEGAGGYGRAEDPLMGWEPPPALPADTPTQPPTPLRLAQVHYFVRHGERAPVRERLAHARPPVPTRWNFCHETNRFRLSVLQRHALPIPVPNLSTNPHPDVPPPEAEGAAAHAGEALCFARADAALLPEPCSSTTNPYHPAYTSAAMGSIPFARRTAEFVDTEGHPQAARAGDCLWGELTDVGRASTYAFGARLKRLYIDHLGLIPPLSTLTQSEGDAWIYLRSTNVQRCAESLQNAVAALLQPSSTDSIAPAPQLPPAPGLGPRYLPTLRVRNSSDEDLLPNTAACPILRRLLRDFSERAARRWNPILAGYDKVLAPHNQDRPLRVDSQPRLSGVFDTLNAALAHGLSIPPDFDPLTRRMMERAVVDEWFGGYVTRSERARTRVRMLGLGPLLKRLADELQDKAAHPPPVPGTYGSGAHGGGGSSVPNDGLRLAVYTAHDTTLSALLATLDVYEARWPAFTASLGVELFVDERPSVQRPTSWSSTARKALGFGSSVPTPSTHPHYVRLRFGDEHLRLPICAAKGNHLSFTDPKTGHEQDHPELCTLEAFATALRKIAPESPEQYAELCELPMEPIHFQQ